MTDQPIVALIEELDDLHQHQRGSLVSFARLVADSWPRISAEVKRLADEAAYAEAFEAEVRELKAERDRLQSEWTIMVQEAQAISGVAQEAVAERDRLRAWKAAVEEAGVVNWTLTAENENDPRKAVAALLAMQSQQALDPAISREAAKWRDNNDRLRAEVDRLKRITHQPCPECGAAFIEVKP